MKISKMVAQVKRGARSRQRRSHQPANPELGGAFTPLYARFRELDLMPFIDHVGKVGPLGRSADFTVGDEEAFLETLRATGRFCRDTLAGRILHPGTTSLREASKADSLHIAIGEDGRCVAHIDRLSPLVATRPEGPCRYSLPRIVVHNGARLVGDLGRLVLGHRIDCAPFPLRVTGPAEAEDQEREGRKLLHVLTPTRRRQESSPPAKTRIPFNPIDEAVHVLNNDVEPWSIQLEVRVAGRLDEDRLRSAITQAIGRHPLARARKAPAPPSSRRYQWEIPAALDLDPLRVVECADDAALAAARARLQSLAVPLSESPPFRAYLARHAADLLMLNVNHAVTDVWGAVRLLRSIARAYAGEPDPVPDLDVVAERDVGSRLAARDIQTRLRRLEVLAEKLGDLIAVPARLAPDPGADEPGYGVHQVRLSKEQTEALGVGEPGISNELLLSALHLAIAMWNVEHGASCGRIGVLLPVNLRPRDWREELVGNFTLLTRVSSRPEDRASAPRLLDAIGAQIRRMEREDTLAALIEVLTLSASFPIWAKQALPALLSLTGNRLVDTGQLAYLGLIEDVPSFGPDAGETAEMWFSPPARMPLGLSIGAVTAVGRLHLAFRYRHPLLSPGAAALFAERYLSALEVLATTIRGGDSGTQRLGLTG